mgnify:CR=1 FL=1
MKAEKEHIGAGVPREALETQIKELGEKIAALSDEGVSAARSGEKDRAASLLKEKQELFAEQQELLRKRADLRAHELNQ